MLLERKDDIFGDWMSALQKSGGVMADTIDMEMRRQSTMFIDELVSATESGNLVDTGSLKYENLKATLAEISANQAKLGFTPRQTVYYLFSLKNTILEFLQDAYGDEPKALGRELVAVNRLIDSLGIVIIEAFIDERENIIKHQQDEILELSTPAIRIWDRVVVVPLIGTLDSTRTQIVMENLLEEIVSSGSEVAILDISGVPAMDTLTAQHLLKTVSAAQLMGATCIVSGIRPEIAQTIVELGIDLTHITTKATLEGALKEALSRLELAVFPVKQDQ